MIGWWAKAVGIRLFQGAVIVVYYAMSPRGTVRRMP